jgi:hypothetical protein
MSTDKEVQEINERKLKEKGAAIVEKQKQEFKYNPENILFQLLEYMRIRGLEMMNVSEDTKAQILNDKQKKRNEQNAS